MCPLNIKFSMRQKKVLPMIGNYARVTDHTYSKGDIASSVFTGIPGTQVPEQHFTTQIRNYHQRNITFMFLLFCFFQLSSWHGDPLVKGTPAKIYFNSQNLYHEWKTLITLPRFHRFDISSKLSRSQCAAALLTSISQLFKYKLPCLVICKWLTHLSQQHNCTSIYHVKLSQCDIHNV